MRHAKFCCNEINMNRQKKNNTNILNNLLQYSKTHMIFKFATLSLNQLSALQCYLRKLFLIFFHFFLNFFTKCFKNEQAQQLKSPKDLHTNKILNICIHTLLYRLTCRLWAVTRLHQRLVRKCFVFIFHMTKD